MPEDPAPPASPRQIRFRAVAEAAGASAAQTRLLTERLGVTDENELAFACRTNRVRDLEGLGPEIQSALSGALRRTPWSTPIRPLAHARRAAARVLEKLQHMDSALRLAVAGDVRRMERWVEDVVLVATAHDPDDLVAHFADLTIVKDVKHSAGPTVTARLPDGTRIVLHVLPEDPVLYVPRLIELTGSAAHWNALVEQAAGLSMALDGRGLRIDGEPTPCYSEAELYQGIGLPVPPPELRKTGWIAAPPEDLVTIQDMRGLVHVHTDDAAGVFPIGEAARRAQHEGFSWLVVADRSPSAFPRGLGKDALRAQRDAVDRVNADPAIEPRVFLGVEARVDPSGALDWPNALLDLADLVIGVVEDPPAPGRPKGGADREAAGNGVSATERFVRAVTHPRVHVLAHPRPASIGGLAHTPHWEAVFAAAASAGTALELSGESLRLPLDLAWHAGARRAGVRLVPSADAHDVDGFDNVLCAVGATRRGAWTVSEVLPTLSADGFAAWLDAQDPEDRNPGETDSA